MPSTPSRFVSNFFFYNFFPKSIFFRKKKKIQVTPLPYFFSFFYLHKLKFFYFSEKKIVSLVIANTTVDTSFFFNIVLKKTYFGIGFFFSKWFSYLSGGSSFCFLNVFRKKKLFLMQRLIEANTFGDSFKKLLQTQHFI